MKHKKKQQHKIPRPITQKVLQEVGRRYLERYVPSVVQFRRVLNRKVERNIRAGGSVSREVASTWIEEEVQRQVECGALQDQRFAISWTQHLHDKGKSLPQIRSTLYQKGISKTIIDTTLQNFQREVEDASFVAAMTYARKRRFGPFQLDVSKRKERRNKDIAAMMRVGHSYDVIQQIFRCESVEELETYYQERE